MSAANVRPRSPSLPPLSLLWLTLLAVPGLAALFAGGVPSPWLLPLATTLALAIGWVRLGRGPHSVSGSSRWTTGSWLTAFAVFGGAAAIAWGCLATPERSWDGFATWGLVARQLLEGASLGDPVFSDPAVFTYARGYPLLLPLGMQQLGAWLGADGMRLFQVVVWLLLLDGVRHAIAAGGGDRRMVRLGVLGAALVPMFVEPGHGSAESGFADLLVAALVAHALGAQLSGSARAALCVGLLLPMAKNEGALHLALWIAVAAASRQRGVANGLLLGGAIALAAWLPVQQQLREPGAALAWTAATFAPLLLLVAARAAGALASRWPRSALVMLATAALVALVTLPGQLRDILGAAIEVDLAAFPGAVGALLGEACWLRRFGASFPLLLLAGAAAWGRRHSHAAWARVWLACAVAATFAAAIVGFLVVVPETKRALFVREGVGRYLSHLVGLAWIVAPLAVLSPAEVPPQPVAARPRWLVWLAPRGSRRERVLWIGFVTVRKLREGPGPWFRAVRKGLFQLLPQSLRARLLRWSGEAPPFRHRDDGPASVDLGVEQPGLVSVVLPVFDQADLLGESIDSVLAQTYAPLELIVLDDGSRDDVHGVLQRYAGDARVRRLTQPNQGLPKALSSAFEFATGEFFTWTSGDNRMHREQLAKLVACLRARPAVAMVWADYRLIDDRGGPLQGGEFRVLDRTDPHDAAIVRTKRTAEDLNRYEDNYVGGCFLYRGRVGRLLGDYNPELGLEDYDYWMRINRLCRLEHLGTDDVLYEYRVHDNTLSAKARELRILERAKVLMQYERQRAAWVQAPLRVFADAASRAWLAASVVAPDTLQELPTNAAWPEGKVLVVVAAASLPQVVAAGPPAHVAIVATFAHVDDVHTAAVALQTLPCACLAADADVAARLAVLRREVFVQTPGPAALALAARYAANATFFRTTRDPQRLQRVVPMPIVEAPCSVLLQCEAGAHASVVPSLQRLATALRERGHRVGLLLVGGRNDAALPAELVACERAELRDGTDAAYQAMLAAGGWQIVEAHGSGHGAVAAAAAGVPFVQVLEAASNAAGSAAAAHVCTSLAAFAQLDRQRGLDVQKAIVLDANLPLAVQVAQRTLLFGWLRQRGPVAGVRTALARVGR